ncbi:unnamed protein product [Gongylonema pulchrum]|uniref:Uncharacterized protein n=1 Tax=Gongylonema pulchrum TaxID=637853 RepID=A0A3P7RQE3_9BILA|nr:unnamed protein product [Gongylonema pulchrum]
MDSLVHLIEDQGSTHPNFRLFACMNPPGDVGKRNLPPGIRNKFTEIFVRETTDLEQLHTIAQAYLPGTDAAKIFTVLNIYETLRAKLPGKYSV